MWIILRPLKRHERKKVGCNFCPAITKKGNHTFNRANLIGHSESEHFFFIRVQGKDPVHIQLLGGGDDPVSGAMPACLVSDVLVEAVGPCLVDGTQREGVGSGTCGGHSCNRHYSVKRGHLQILNTEAFYVRWVSLQSFSCSCWSMSPWEVWAYMGNLQGGPKNPHRCKTKALRGRRYNRCRQYSQRMTLLYASYAQHSISSASFIPHNS